MSSLWIYWGGFILGCLHALDADHVCAVSAFVIRENSWRQAARLSLEWSCGHSLTLLLLAVAARVLRLGVEGLYPQYADRCVGAALIALSCWVFWREWRRPQTAHHGRRPFLFGIGVLHGLAGSAAVFLLPPAMAAPAPPWGVVLYIACFSLGMILAMAVYSLTLHKMAWLDYFSARARLLRVASGIAAMLAGMRLLFPEMA